MCIREGVYKLRYRIIGNYLLHHHMLMHPSEHGAVCSQLHPHGVLGIIRYHPDVGHNKMLVLVDCERVCRQVGYPLLRLLALQHERVAIHHKVVVACVVAVDCTSIRIGNFLYAVIQHDVSVLRFAVATAKRKDHEHHQYDISTFLHTHSSGILCNQTEDGTAVRRPSAAREVLSIEVSVRHASHNIPMNISGNDDTA